MKTIIMLIMVLTPVSLIAQEIGVIKEFSKRSPAFPLGKRSNVAAGDVNGDGIPEIIVVQGQNILLIDPTDPNMVYLTVDLSKGGAEVAVEEVEFIGLVEFSGQEYVLVEAAAQSDDWMAVRNGIIAILISLKDEEIAYLGEGRVVSLLKPPSGKTFIVQYLEEENTFRLIGDLSDSASLKTTSIDDLGIDRSKVMINPYRRNKDYILEDKYWVESGHRLAFDPEFFSPAGETDINNDGISDLPMLVHDEQNGVSGMLVRSGDSLTILWQFPFPEENRSDLMNGFHGFIDADADGEKEAIFGDNLAVTLDGAVHKIADDFVIIDIDDFDNDGYEDIMGWNIIDSSVHIYGAGTQVVAVSQSERAKPPMFETYPNPFDEQTNINYSLSQSSTVEVTIYDLSGKFVHQILRGHQLPGIYNLTWDGRDGGGRDMNSGIYLCTMKINDHVDTQRILFLNQ